MKETGIVRGIDRLGRVVLPKELRKTLGIASGDELAIYTCDGQIILKKYKTPCVFCGSTEALVIFSGEKVCQPCLRQLKKTQN